MLQLVKRSVVEQPRMCVDCDWTEQGPAVYATHEIIATDLDAVRVPVCEQHGKDMLVEFGVA